MVLGLPKSYRFLLLMLFFLAIVLVPSLMLALLFLSQPISVLETLSFSLGGGHGLAFLR